MVRPSPARRVRPHEDHARSRQEVAHVRPHACNFTVSSCCIFRQSATVAVSFDIGSLQYGFYKSSTRLRYKSATRLRSANPGITDERDSFNEGGSERGTAVTQRQRYKGRNGWVNEEWGTELGALLILSNEGNHFCSKHVTDWPPSQLKRERPDYSQSVTSLLQKWLPSFDSMSNAPSSVPHSSFTQPFLPLYNMQKRDRLATESAEEREARLQQMRDWLATESAEER